MKAKKIIFTGGGSGGHLFPALNLMDSLSDRDVYYIGSKTGIERKVVETRGIDYYPIETGKLRRYFSIQNLKDVFKFLFGIIESFFIMLRFDRDTIVFSTGGFVSVAPVIAGKLTGKKVYIHEQTSQAGLANKISSSFADKVFVSFEKSINNFPKEKTVYTGYPLREECLDLKLRTDSFQNISLKIDNILFITGGGNGSFFLNNYIKSNLEYLKSKFLVIHQVGQNYIEEYKTYADDRYVPIGFVNTGMIDLFKSAKVIISRAGAGTVCELLALNKPSIFIPLAIAQKNEQFYNAKEAKTKLGSVIIEEKSCDTDSLIDGIEKLLSSDKADVKQSIKNGTEEILKYL